MASSNTTLREIAQSAQVSIASVSYVLNGKPGISDGKRREISKLLEKSGLKPKHLRNPIFYICRASEFSNIVMFPPFFQMYQGLNSACHEENVALRLEFLHSQDGRDLGVQLQELASYKPGAVVLDSNLGDALPRVAEFFGARHLPVVQVGHTVKAAGFGAVIVDDFSGAYAGTRHLAMRGHKKIATIRWAVSQDPASNKKHAGYLCALEDAGVPVVADYIVESPFKREKDELTGRVAIEKLLSLPDPPTAVFVENSFVSAPLLYPIRSGEMGLPADIAALDMVHFEAWSLDVVEQVMRGMFCYPERQTKLLQINWEQMGRMAGKRVVDMMGGGVPMDDVIRIAPRLVEMRGFECTPLDGVERADPVGRATLQ